ncbi:transposase [Tuberibacillus sp. Marseille-P3662]|uniref:transposase n=1 Tax=Tuberibacillus sp. Marseille-P3662 TaxID=1965358 RepID=UPI00111BD9EB|nr:transposase [Tuberibacillus sp. Marseille-P3662]
MANQTLTEREPSPVIGIDEMAILKGHKYETVVTDILTGQVHQMGRNRKYQSIIDLL